MSESQTQEKSKELVIDPKELPEGACLVRKFGDGKVSICKEGGKIKIFEVVKED
ncbi:MAG: hypothetical protein Q8O76_06565 [Chloroflexota bacterium]|nr:hypothetical protein [Chloroflexota bacterium]